MEGFFVLLGLAAIGVPVAGLVLGIVALNKIGDLSSRLRILEERGTISPAVPAAVAVMPEPAKPAKAAAKAREPVISKAVEPSPVAAPEPIAVKTALPPPEPNPAKSLEGTLASRWLVWIGGGAVALGGILFVRYAAEHNLFPPAIRILLGLILGGILIAAGEYARRSIKEAGNYVPAALSSGGLVTAFGSIYAAHALYGLLGPTTAFLGLGLVALGALLLSRLQGPLVAAVGLIGSYLTPALIISPNPQALGLFIYLAVILAACFWITRERRWWWLAGLALAGSAGWALLWVETSMPATSDTFVIGLFAFVIAGIGTFALEGRRILAAETGNLLKPEAMSPALLYAAAAMALGAVVLADQVRWAGHSNLAVSFFLLGMAGIAAFSWMKQGTSLAAPAAAGFTWVVLMAWPGLGIQPWQLTHPELQVTIPGIGDPFTFFRWMAVALVGFTAMGAAGYLRRVPDLVWACLAAAAPVLYLVGAWARMGTALSNPLWALMAGALGLLLIALAYRKRSDENAPAALLGGAALLFVFAAFRLTEDVWLTLVISALALVAAASTRVFTSRHVGLIATGLASVAAIRLFARHNTFDAPGLPWGAHWPLYGYGLPAIAFLIASRFLTAEKLARYRTALEGISLGLGISLVSLEIRALIAGGQDVHDFTLLELGAHICAWLGAAFGLAYRQKLYSSFIALWGARILLAASCLALFFGAFIWLNPILVGSTVQGGPVFNSLVLAYLAPCVLIVLILQKSDALGLRDMRGAIGLLALASLVVYVTLEVKRLFQGEVIDIPFMTEAESYTLSAVWLGLAVILFIAGLKLGRSTARYAGLAVMALAMLKTFGFDLWHLGGLWQIASVMGIGLSLVGIGWLYARFMRGNEGEVA